MILPWFRFLNEYWKKGIWSIDFWIFRYYSFGRAYRTSLKNRPEKRLLGLTYGETPFSTFWKVMDWVQYQEGESFLELGCGTGRLSLIASKSMKLHCLGIDCIVPFVDNANRIATALRLEDCRFEKSDFFDVSWSDADIVYITATACTGEQVQRMSEKCMELKAGARLISLTHPPKSEYMKTLGMNVFSFSWGSTAVFFSVRSIDE